MPRGAGGFGGNDVNQVRNAALEEAAVIAEGKVDTEFPNDDMSMQCKAIADEIRSLKVVNA